MTALLPLFARYWQAIIGGIAVLILSVTLSIRTHERDTAYASFWKAKGAYDTEVASHAVTRQSLNSALAIIDAKNAESDARGRAYAGVKVADAADVTGADARAKADEPRRRTLEALVALPSGCRAPDALTSSLKGL